MTQSKRTKDKSASRNRQAVASAEEPDILSWLLKAIVAALLVARLLVMTEAAVGGDSLWMVQLWLAALVLWVWHSFRERSLRPRVDWFDLFLWLFILGHAASTAWVFIEGGDRRAAVNVCWEWVGLGVTFFLVRQVIRTSLDRQRLTLVMVATATGLAGLGLWQHYHFYPAQTRAYEATRRELDQLEQAPPPTTTNEAGARQLRIDGLRQRLSEQGIPLVGRDRLLWEARLRASSEPFGLFALANSFAGLLLVWLLVASGILKIVFTTDSDKSDGGPSKSRIANRIVAVFVVGLMFFCLVLTKSRTAYAGFVFGTLVLGVISLRGRVFAAAKSKPWLIGAGVLTVAVVFAVAGLSGGFDRKVVSEAGKSLAYRMQYWTGAWHMLQQRPVFGTGPGNFRQHYLEHKLAESSEEIADPHNFVLDVWSSGGLLALSGLVGMVLFGFFGVRVRARAANSGDTGTSSVSTSPHHPGEMPPHRFSYRDPVVLGASGGFAFIWGLGWVFGEIDVESYQFFALPALGLAYIVLVRLLARAIGPRAVPAACFVAAGAGLVCHLLGAGGIEMPAIAQTLLLLPALAHEWPARPADLSVPRLPAAVPAIGIAAIVAFVACLQTATGPVMQRKTLMLQSAGQSRDHLEASYRIAAVRDPLSSEPLERLADLELNRWYLQSADDENRFNRAVEFQQLANGLNPYASSGYEKLGKWYAIKFARSHHVDDAQKSVESYERAVARYPTSVALQADYAHACNAAGQNEKARQAAQTALELDDVNHQQGHRDKFLPVESVAKLQQLLKTN